LPGNSTTCDVTALLTDLTTASSFTWSPIVEPPTRIKVAPDSSARFAVVAASLGVKSSGSISAANIGFFFDLSIRSLSTVPLVANPHAPTFAKSSTNVL